MEIPTRFQLAGWGEGRGGGHAGGVDELTRLALEARDGDGTATAEFVRRSQGEVWRLVAHLVDRGAADDLTQEVYERALRSLRSFRGDASARTWLLTIARRTCVDTIRRRTRERAREARMRSVAVDVAVSLPEPTGELEALVASLDPDRRMAFVLTQLLGYGYAEAAEVCDCPVGTIRSRVARARADLLAALDEGSAPDAAQA